MPRMIYWNVEDFSDNKFFNRKRKLVNQDKEEYGADPAERIRNILVNTVTAHLPDFIVIVEAVPGVLLAPGTLLDDRGGILLLERLRNNAADPNAAQWALVPPVSTGTGNMAEGVLVYYRHAPNFFFTGPWRWPGGTGPAAPLPAVGAAPAGTIYPPDYRWSFSRPVDNRLVPGGLHNVGQKERTLAGQWLYVVPPAGGAAGPAAPTTFGVAGSRAPFRTTFYDQTANQNYSIFACHTAPGQDGGAQGAAAAPSVQATQTIAALPEVQAVNAAETVVVVGDFNVSLFNAVASAAAYGPFTAAAVGFTQMIAPTAGNPVPGTYPSRGYLGTHIAKAPKATPANTRGYPAFGYISPGTDPIWQYDSIDNGFVRGGAPANATIANIITGAPYPIIPPAAGVPTGFYAYPQMMSSTAAALNVPVGYVLNSKQYEKALPMFQNEDNFGLIRGVSDHLPLVFDF
ncbi:hypothetical protein GCM10009839_41670 [Catenulispora yoronensis]|uniref:Endonuclease/exonuclease/phosphatase domain-containing protein n=1 Tax=Catenulispora yoronensis TaxID=450799 RepID=A0ABP5FXT3_9ACTN